MEYFEDIDINAEESGDLLDELPLWSAPFGLLLLERVPIKPGLRILDVGAGTGFLTVELAQRCWPDTKVIAVDPWTAGMRRLRRKIDHLGLSNVMLIEGDAAALHLPPESIDVVVSNLGVNNFENADAVLRECYRVAKPNARLLLTTNLIGHMVEFYDVYRATLIELGQQDRLAALDAHISHRGTVESVAKLIQDAGFSVTNIVTGSFHMRFASGSSLLRHHFIRLGFLPAWRAVTRADSLHKTFESLERNLNAVAADRGELTLTVPMACLEARRAPAGHGGTEAG